MMPWPGPGSTPTRTPHGGRRACRWCAASPPTSTPTMSTSPSSPAACLPARKPRAVPFIYSQQDIDALLAACDTEFADERIAATLRTVIGLLAATGLRISEALNLRVDDIDQHNDLLMIKAAKSHERLVPVHPSTTAALLQYIALPARMATHPDPHGPVFVTSKGTGYVYVSFQSLFKRVREAAGLAPRGRARPRLHDLQTHLRHRAHDRGLRPRR